MHIAGLMSKNSLKKNKQYCILSTRKSDSNETVTAKIIRIDSNSQINYVLSVKMQ